MIRIDPKAMAFRRERATDLEQLAKFIDRRNVNISQNPSFKDAIRFLKDDTHVFLDEKGKPDASLWGYNIDRLSVAIPVIPRHTTPAVQQLSLRISIKFTADWQGWQKMQDPSRQLNLNVLLLGKNKDASNCLSSYHLDKHIDLPPPDPKAKPDPRVKPDPKAKPVVVPKANLVPAEAHPLYHVQFGSAKIGKEKEALGLDLVNSGNLFMDTPRLMHHPLDLVLGIDFLLSNYLPVAWDALQRDGHYANLCRKYQAAFWKPYIHAIAKHWDLHRDKDCWNAKNLIWPNLL
ncbi:hypothetical protein [Hymenobacter sp. PAMC 26628]|uniref:hypothetical protein n=1 Tax=Hymenobacter sp. PAMC 26628 TaxID=1484118 RepID=UPI000B00E1E4|nr:hypothetical protein [Hymenobacter sp. PAMC 26628]